MTKDERDEIRRNSGDMRVYKLQEHLLKALTCLDALEAENERLKEALNFYAAPEKYIQESDGYLCHLDNEIDIDEGQRARDALQGRS